MCPSKVPDGEERGWIIPIGGAEEKENDRAILARFVELCGGADADIVVIPTASKLRGTGPRYEEIFGDLGVGRVAVMDFDTRRDADEPSRVERIEQATGVFFTGGNQLRLSTLIGGTAVAKAIRVCNARGTHVAGTSAGAAFLSEHMIAFGEEGPTPIAGMVRLAPGLGLTNRFVIDQHFRQRDRLGRLAYAVATHPGLLGVGVDENTAAIVENDSKISVIGKHAVTIVDGKNITASNVAEVIASRPIAISGLQVHVLTPGCTFDIRKRTAYIPPLVLE